MSDETGRIEGPTPTDSSQPERTIMAELLPAIDAMSDVNVFCAYGASQGKCWRDVSINGSTYRVTVVADPQSPMDEFLNRREGR